MDYLAVGAFAWLAVFVVLGLFRGFWKALAAAVSLVVAYLASAFFAPFVTRFLLKQFPDANLNSMMVHAVSAIALFMLVGLLVRLAIQTLGKFAPIRNPTVNAGGGGIISGAYGAALGIALIWSISLIWQMWSLKTEGDIEVSPQFQNSRLVVFSRHVVAQVVGWNVRRAGGTEAEAELSSAIAERPDEVLSEVRNTLQSQEFKRMMNSDDIKGIVEQNNAQALQHHPDFIALMQQPAVQKLRVSLQKGGVAWSEDVIANHALEIWGNVDAVKKEPEMQALLADPEVQQFLQGGGDWSPSLLQKAQHLLTVVTRKADQNDVHATEPQLYHWYDDEGQLQMGSSDEIPADKRAKARMLNP